MSGGQAASEVAGELASRLDEFQLEHPDLVRELDLLGAQIDEYETVVAESGPGTITQCFSNRCAIS